MRNLRLLGWPSLLLASIGVWLALVASIHGYLLQDRMGRGATEALATQRMVADIVPPPLLLIELRLVLSQAVEGTIDAGEARHLFDRLAGDYRRRADHGPQDPPRGLDPLWLDPPHETGLRFIAAARSGVIDPLSAGNAALARSQLAAVHALYLEHRAAVDRATVRGQQVAERSMAQFESSATQSFMVALVLTAAAIVLVCAVWRLAIDGGFAVPGRRRPAPAAAMPQPASCSAAPGLAQAGPKPLEPAAASPQAPELDSLHLDLSALQDQLTASSTTQAAAQVHDSSQLVVGLLLVIDDIALQTQVLSMNAAVAAARAGEQGRVVSAVASEVRVLAGQSADAARLIKALAATRPLDDAHSATLAASASAVAIEVLAAIARVRDRIQQAGEAAGASPVDPSTQHKAALLLEVRQEAIAAADRLRQRADWLAQAVAMFRLSRG